MPRELVNFLVDEPVAPPSALIHLADELGVVVVAGGIPGFVALPLVEVPEGQGVGVGLETRTGAELVRDTAPRTTRGLRRCAVKANITSLWVARWAKLQPRLTDCENDGHGLSLGHAVDKEGDLVATAGRHGEMDWLADFHRTARIDRRRGTRRRSPIAHFPPRRSIFRAIQTGSTINTRADSPLAGSGSGVTQASNVHVFRPLREIVEVSS